MHVRTHERTHARKTHFVVIFSVLLVLFFIFHVFDEIIQVVENSAAVCFIFAMFIFVYLFIISFHFTHTHTHTQFIISSSSSVKNRFKLRIDEVLYKEVTLAAASAATTR